MVSGPCLLALLLAASTPAPWTQAGFHLCFVQKGVAERFCIEKGDRYRVKSKVLVIRRRVDSRLPESSPRAWQLVSLRLKDVDLAATMESMDEQREADERRRQAKEAVGLSEEHASNGIFFDGETWVAAEELRMEQERERLADMTAEELAAYYQQQHEQQLIETLRGMDGSLMEWGCGQLYGDGGAGYDDCVGSGGGTDEAP